MAFSPLFALDAAATPNIENWLFPVPPINLPPPSDLATGILHTTDNAADLYFPAQ